VTGPKSIELHLLRHNLTLAMYYTGIFSLNTQDARHSLWGQALRG